MISLPISAFIETNLYFSIFVFGAAAILLIGKYGMRWHSDIVSGLIGIFTYGIAAWLAWSMTGNISAIIIGCVFNMALLFFYRKLIPILSVFGLFFLISMIMPSLYGLSWLFELSRSLSAYLQAEWPLFLLICIAAFVCGGLIVINTTMLCCIAIVRFSDIYFRFPRRDAAWKVASKPRETFPGVSIHIPCYAEPPEMVIKTLDALAQMQYPHFEVIVIDNNTKDINLWKPLQAHCKKLGDRFRFFHLNPLKGAKAGALNFALNQTMPSAEYVAIVDADYIAEPDFLKKLIGFFDNPKTGFVQTCHDYRDWKESTYLSACYYEYEMHFKLDLPGQSEWDTAYTVGTMCLIRRKALEEVGGWAEWCLTEDSEVAVRLHALGYEGYYLKDTFGRGLIPETFEGYKIQRFRWTAGPVQQFQKHWRLYLPWNHSNQLTFKQKLAEVFHSLSLLFSESLFLLITLPTTLAFIWLRIVKGHITIIPPSIWLFVLVIMGRNVILNWVRNQLVHGNWRSYLFSSIAARSLTYTKIYAFYMALFSKNLAWKRTDKFKMSPSFWRAFYSSRAELIAGFIYLTGFALLIPYGNYSQPDVICLIMLGMFNQAFSHLCAPLMAFLSEKEIIKEEQTQKTNLLNLDTEQKEIEHSKIV